MYRIVSRRKNKKTAKPSYLKNKNNLSYAPSETGSGFFSFFFRIAEK
jgi:hypothetical protein